jgi:hypothetical protein
VLGGNTLSLVCTLTYVSPLSIAARIEARSVQPHALPGSAAVIVPSARVPSEAHTLAVLACTSTIQCYYVLVVSDTE